MCNKVPRPFYFFDAVLEFAFLLLARDFLTPEGVLFFALAAGAARFAAGWTFFFGAPDDGDFSVASFGGAA